MKILNSISYNMATHKRWYLWTIFFATYSVAFYYLRENPMGRLSTIVLIVEILYLVFCVAARKFHPKIKDISFWGATLLLMHSPMHFTSLSNGPKMQNLLDSVGYAVYIYVISFVWLLFLEAMVSLPINRKP